MGKGGGLGLELDAGERPARKIAGRCRCCFRKTRSPFTSAVEGG